MVKVVTPEEPFNYEFMCRSKLCQQMLQADTDDVQVGNFGTYGDSITERHYYVTCPHCQEENIIPDELVTPYLRLYVSRKEQS